QDLLAEGHGPRRRDRRPQRHLPLEAGDVVVEQSTVLDDSARDLTLPARESRQGDLLALPHALEDREVGGDQEPKVLAVLAIDALHVLRDHEFDPGGELRVRRLLARRTLAAPRAAHRGDEAAAPHGAARDGELVSALEPE